MIKLFGAGGSVKEAEMEVVYRAPRLTGGRRCGQCGISAAVTE